MSGLEAAKETLYQAALYSNEQTTCATLLDLAAEAMSGKSGEKMVVISSASCYNNSEMEERVRALATEGIEVRVVAFEKDAQRIAAVEAAYENVIVSRDVRELPILLGEWYAKLAELEDAPVMRPNAAGGNADYYNSSYRKDKHEYRFGTSSQFKNMTWVQKLGACMAKLLNIYYLLPTWAEGDGSYKITDGNSCKWIGKGNMFSAFGESDYLDAEDMITFWGHQAYNLQETEYVLKNDRGLTGDMREVIVENLKRRMPVLVSMGPDEDNTSSYLITGYYDDMSGKCELTTESGGRITKDLQAESNVKILDTGRYFNMLRGAMYIDDEQSGTANTKTVTITLPEGYTEGSAEESVQSYRITKDTYEAMQSSSYEAGQVSYTVGRDTEFVVSVRTEFNGITPNCYNGTRNYIIKIYPDVTEGQWFAEYVFDMSNQGLLIGSEGEDGVIRFLPDDEMTIAEFLTVVYRAADIAGIVPYTTIMAVDALNRGWIDAEQYQQVLYGIGAQTGTARGIRREEAADILWQIFMSEQCRVPHQLYEYDLEGEYRAAEWEAYIDKDNFNRGSYQRSFHQLFLNGVLAGTEAYRLEPKGRLTRAQACKIISKALYSLAEMGSTLDPAWSTNGAETLTLGVTSSGSLSSYGGRTYEAVATQAGYYMVSTSAQRYVVYNAAGIRQEAVGELDGKDVYMVTEPQTLRLYVSGPSGAAVTTTVERASDGYIVPPPLKFTKDYTRNYIYVNNPEYITRYDIVDDTKSSDNLKLFEQTEVSGQNTYYQTHVAWWGDEAVEFEPRYGFYLDVDFYNPTAQPVTISVDHLSYGTDYAILQTYFSGGISKEITIQPYEHVLLFESLDAPLYSEHPGGEPIDWDWYRSRKQAILFDFTVSSGGHVTVSSLAAYNRSNLYLQNGEENKLLNSGETINKGEVIYSSGDRKNETDIYNKYKGIAENQSAWIDAELSYVVDDAVESGSVLPVQMEDDLYPDGVWGPNYEWMTHLNPINDAYGAFLYIMPATLHHFTYHYLETDRKWNFAFDYQDGLSFTPEGGADVSVNKPVPESVIKNVKQDVAAGQNHFQGAPYIYSLGMGSWGATYHYTITVRNEGDSERSLGFRVKNYDNMIFGYKLAGTENYITQFDPSQGDDWWEAVSVGIPAHSSVTFEVVTLLAGGHGGTTYSLILE